MGKKVRHWGRKTEAGVNAGDDGGERKRKRKKEANSRDTDYLTRLRSLPEWNTCSENAALSAPSKAQLSLTRALNETERGPTANQDKEVFCTAA